MRGPGGGETGETGTEPRPRDETRRQGTRDHRCSSTERTEERDVEGDHTKVGVGVDGDVRETTSERQETGSGLERGLEVR